MATRPNIADKTDHLDAYKIQENYEVETVKVLSQVKHLVRNITTGTVNFIHAKLNKLPIATSVERLQEFVNCIFEEAVSLLLPEDVGNESTNRMQMFAKLCKLCAEIEASDSHSDVKEVITFQRILIKTILSEFDRISKQPSCEEKLLNFLKNVKISDNKKLDRVRTFSVQMEKNENKSALKRIDFVIELYLWDIVDTEVLVKIVQYIITMANLSLMIECLHTVLSFISIDLNSLEWGNDTKSEFLSGLSKKMTELLQDNSTPETTKHMILDLVGLWPNEYVKEFQDDDEIKPKNLLRDVTLKRSENPWRPRRIAVNFLTEEEAEFEPQRFFGPAPMAQMRPQPRWPAQPAIRRNAQAPGTGYPTMQPPYRSLPRAPTATQPSMRNKIAAHPITGQQPGIQRRSGPIGGTQTVSVSAQGRTANYKYIANMRNPPQPMPVTKQAQVQQAVHIQGQEPLTATMLDVFIPQDQKQMLGERLFPLIRRMYPDLAGKITGMLLEIDNSELLHMLEHSESLKSKVEEAVAKLQAHQAKKAGQIKKG